jgi:hypothetical protein
MRPAAFEHAGEKSAELAIDLVEDLREAFTALAVDLADRSTELGDRAADILAIPLHRGKALFDFGDLDLGAEIDRPHLITLAGEAFEAPSGAVDRCLRRLRDVGQGRLGTKPLGDPLSHLADDLRGLGVGRFCAEACFAGGGGLGLGVARSCGRISGVDLGIGKRLCRGRVGVCGAPLPLAAALEQVLRV